MDDQISQFSAITGASADRARFFIESSGGDVQAAIATYYESEGQEAGDEGAEQGEESTVVPPTATAGQSAPSAPSAAAPSGGPRTLSGAPAEPLPAGWGSGSGSGSGSRTGGSSSSRNQPTTSSTGFSAGGGIRTFRDLAGDAPSGRGGGGGGGRGDDDDEDDDDDDDPQNLFAGGERSGLSVQNPDSGRRRRGDQPDVVSEILRRAAAAGAAGGGDGQHGFGDDEGQVPANSAPTPASFGGAGRTIGDEGSGSEAPIPATGGQPTASAPSGNDEGGEEDDPVVTRQLTFWSDGFSIGDGALQRYDDPQSAALLAAIENNNAPPEAFGIRFGQRVVIQVAKRLGEKYSPPPPAPMKAFSGGGNRLGSPAPATTTGANESASTSGSSSTATTASNAAAPQEVSVDESKPTTRIQIRLADGTRLVGRFNQESHTVAHIRGFINASSPGMSARSYALQTSFPPKAIEDESQTLKDAGLVNAVVQQKWA